jgi:hypothetical protein
MGLVAFMVVAVSATKKRVARSGTVYNCPRREAINYLLTSAMSREN